MNIRIISICCIILSSFLVLGCKQENPNPELLDPIYKDLEKEAKSFKKLYDEESKKIEELKEKQTRAKARSLEKKQLERDLKKSTPMALKYKQMSKYYEIRAKRRKFEGRQSYKRAFSKEEDWPRPEEYQQYLVHKRLRSASKNWGSRVPKLKDRVMNSQPKPEKPKSE